jgi:DNA-binding NtrC family response regulator
MPGMDGLTLYRKIREEKAEVVAVIVTAYATPQTARDALLAGARQVLAKPVDIAQLLDLVDEAVHQPMVMVVDDDVDLCQSLWEVFREHGLRVCITHTESDAVRRLQERDFQVVLVDLKLPEGDGQRVLETIRDQAPETRSILITGHRDELERKLHAPSAPQADAVCYKPFQIPELLDAIARLAQRQN